MLYIGLRMGMVCCKNYYRWIHALTKRFSQILGPRGHGKTKIVSVGYVLQSIEAQRYKLIYYFSADEVLTKRLMSELIEAVEENPLLSYLKPPNPELWGQHLIITSNKVKVVARPFSVAQPGPHPELIVCDDICVDKNSNTTQKQREMLKTFFGVLYPMLNLTKANSKMVLVGVPQNPGDIHDSLQTHTEFLTIKDKAVRDDGSLFAPELYTKETLDTIKKSIGDLWRKEYQMEHVDFRNNPIKMDMVQKCLTTDYPIILSGYHRMCLDEIERISVGYDPADGIADMDEKDWELEKHDYAKSRNAWVATGMLKDGRVVIIYALALKDLTYDQQVGRCRNVYEIFDPSAFMVESNRNQSIYLDYLNKNVSGFRYVSHPSLVTNTWKDEAMRGLINLIQYQRILIPWKDQLTRQRMSVLLDELMNMKKVDGRWSGGRFRDDLVLALLHSLRGLFMDTTDTGIESIPENPFFRR